MEYNFSKLINSKLASQDEEEKKKKQQEQAAKAENVSIQTDDKSSENKLESTKDSKPLASEQQISKVNQGLKTAITNQPTETEKSVDQILQEAKDIENKYINNDYIDAPDSLGLSKVEVPNMNEDDMKTLAENSLAQKYGDKKENTNQSFSKQIEALLNKQQTSKAESEKKYNQINDIYNKGISQTEEQALKRGLARSSIIIGQISSLEGSRADELVGVLNDLESNLSNIEKQISGLEAEKQTALSNLDIEYAIDLEEKLASIKKDYDKAKQDAIAFNNNVEKLEAEYKLDLEKQKREKQKLLTEYAEKYGVNYTYNLIKDKQYDHFKNYFDSIDKDKALDILLTNDEFKVLLGNKYSQMYKYLRDK